MIAMPIHSERPEERLPVPIKIATPTSARAVPKNGRQVNHLLVIVDTDMFHHVDESGCAA
jgi:hypothetical protein